METRNDGVEAVNGAAAVRTLDRVVHSLGDRRFAWFKRQQLHRGNADEHVEGEFVHGVSSPAGTSDDRVEASASRAPACILGLDVHYMGDQRKTPLDIGWADGGHAYECV